MIYVCVLMLSMCSESFVLMAVSMVVFNDFSIVVYVFDSSMCMPGVINISALFSCALSLVCLFLYFFK